MRALPVFLSTALSLSLVVCATDVPPTVTHSPVGELIDEPEVFLVASRQRERIAAALTEAGFKVSNSASAPYALEVGVGSNRARRGCGTKNNVSYTLNTNNLSVLQIKARGYTGNCEPNVFDEMSATMASKFVKLLAVSSPPPD
jgi:hypothetical protein